MALHCADAVRVGNLKAMIPPKYLLYQGILVVIMEEII